MPRNKLDGSDEFYINFLRIYKVTFRKISIFVAAVHWGWAMDCPIFFSTLVLRFPLFLFNTPPLAERDYLQFSQRLCFFNFFCFLFVFLLFFLTFLMGFNNLSHYFGSRNSTPYLNLPYYMKQSIKWWSGGFIRGTSRFIMQSLLFCPWILSLQTGFYRACIVGNLMRKDKVLTLNIMCPRCKCCTGILAVNLTLETLQFR